MLCKRMAVMAITAGLVADTLAFTGTHLLLVPGASPSTRARSPALCMAALQPKPVRPVAVKSIFVDEQRMLKDQKFPIAPDDLIAKAKIFLESRGGFGADPDLLADDFKFYGPVVGPLPKDEFISAIGSVDMNTAFPDFQGEFYAFNVDPFEGDRVWYIARGRGTNTGPMMPFSPQATEKSVENPPQACSLTFDEKGLVTKYTIGYVMDRTVGNTGGLGGLYGILYAIGKPLPFPEARPWNMGKRYKLFNKVGGFLQKLAAKKEKQEQ